MFRSKRNRKDFAAEVEAHLRLEADRFREQGLTEEAAQAAARRAFGNRTIVEERFYDSRSLLWDPLLRDLRSAFRALGRERSFTAFAVILIGLGAGLTTAMFALFDGVVLRKLAVPDPDSLVHIVSVTQSNRDGALRYSIFEGLRQNLDVADAMFGWNGTLVPVTHNGQTQTIPTKYIAGDFERTMGARPILGRLLTPGDNDPVVVLSDAYWQRMGSDPNIVGKVIRAGPVALTVVGVVPAGSLEIIRFYKSDIAVPLRIGMLLESVPPERVFRYNVETTVRLKPHVSREQLQQRLNALWPRLVAETIPPGHSLEEWTRIAGRQLRVLPGNRGRRWSDENLPRVTLTLLLLAALATLTMCTNLAGLLLSRGLAKHKEYAVRMALGAKRWHVVRYALVEVLVLSCFGGAAAILLAHWLTELCSRALSFGILQADYGVKVDGGVIAFALLLSVATAVAAQIVPALRMSSVNVAESIKAGTHTISARLGGRKGVLVVQVAASLVLVSGSVLFVRTLQLLTRVDTGFRAEDVLALRLTGRVPWSDAQPEFFHELLRRVRAIPSVTAAGLSDRVPMEMETGVSEPVAAIDARSTVEQTSDRGCAWPGYFEALQTPILAGRDFQISDTNSVILTRELAHRLFPGVEPLGQYVRVGRTPQIEKYQVIGVVGDIRLRSPRQEHTRMLFVPCRSVWKAPQTMYAMGLAIRVSGPMAAVEAAVRRELDAMGKQAILQALPLQVLVSKSMRNEQMLTAIASGFGGFTLILACAGVYALIDLAAAARRRELGIRMALGADRQRILGFMMNEAARVIAVGACIGLVVTIIMSRLYRAFLYGVAGFEPLLLAASLALVAFFAMGAALLPAWRAARLEPGSVLRSGV